MRVRERKGEKIKNTENDSVNRTAFIFSFASVDLARWNLREASMTPVPGTHTPGSTSSEFPARCRWERVAGAAASARERACAEEELGGVEGAAGEMQGLVRPGRGDGTPASVRAASRRERSPHFRPRPRTALVPRSFTRPYRVFSCVYVLEERGREGSLLEEGRKRRERR